MKMALFSTVVGILMAFVTMFAIILNSLILIVICWNRSLNKPLNLFLLNLAVADIGMVCTCIPYAIGQVVFREKGLTTTFCYVNSFIVTLFAASTAIIMVVLCLYQYIMVTGPLDTEVSMLKSCIFLILAWIIAIALAMGPLFKFGKYEFSSSIFGCKFSQIKETERMAYNGALMITLFLLPILVLAYCYMSVAIYMSDEETRTAKGCVIASVANNDGCLETGKKRTSAAVCFILVAFVAFRTPFFVSIMLSAFRYVGPKWLSLADQIAFWALYFHAASDPFVYALQHGEYTHTLHLIGKTMKSRMVTVCCCCCHTVEEGEKPIPRKPSLERIEEEE